MSASGGGAPLSSRREESEADEIGFAGRGEAQPTESPKDIRCTWDMASFKHSHGGCSQSNVAAIYLQRSNRFQRAAVIFNF